MSVTIKQCMEAIKVYDCAVPDRKEEKVEINGDALFINDVMQGRIVEHDKELKVIVFEAHSVNRFVDGQLFRLQYL